MLSTVSPVMVGAEAASPQPVRPSSASMRTSTLSAVLISTPAMKTGFFIGKLTAIGSTRLIFTLQSPQSDHLFTPHLRDLVRVQPQLAGENLLVVLAEHRRRAPHRAGRVRKFERDAEHLQGADGGMLDGLDHVACGGVR